MERFFWAISWGVILSLNASYDISFGQTSRSLYVVVRDASGIVDSLRFGEATGATDGLDPSLGEFELPPLPPSGAYDIRWLVTGVEGTSIDFRDTLNAQRKRNTWQARVQPGAGGYPITVRWNRANLWDGFFYLRDIETNGATFSVDMKERGSVTITSATIRTIEIVHIFSVSRSIELGEGWNLVSVPLEVRDWRKETLFPAITSPIYRYAGTYIATDTLQRHPGYWVGASTAHLVEFVGEPFTTDTFLVQQGWNMLGSIFSEVEVQNVVQVPDGIIGSFFFTYRNGYRPTNVIAPGRGHWVKTNQSGKIVLGTNAMRKRASTSSSLPSYANWSWLRFVDVLGREGLLYFTETEATEWCEIPPVPSSSVPDVRFVSQRFAEKFDAVGRRHMITLQGFKFPVRVSFKITERGVYNLDQPDLEISYPLFGEGFTLHHPAREIFLSLSAFTPHPPVPSDYALSQNYPNPFNPATQIQYALPSRSFVNLTIFNLLGQRVTELVNTEQEAGYHQIEWQATNAASGVYFYRLEAIALDNSRQRFLDTRKMLLLR